MGAVPHYVAAAIARYLSDATERTPGAARRARIIMEALDGADPRERKAILDGYPWGGVLETEMGLRDDEIMRRAARLATSRMTPRAKHERARKAAAVSATKRTTVLEFQGRSLTIREWARELGISSSALHQRLKARWPLGRALMAPRSDPASARASRAPTPTPEHP